MPRQLAAADGVKGNGGAGLGQGIDQLVHKIFRRHIADIPGAHVFQNRCLLWFAHDIDQINAVGQADLVQHLA